MEELGPCCTLLQGRSARQAGWEGGDVRNREVYEHER
jgi:hypothetical protein